MRLFYALLVLIVAGSLSACQTTTDKVSITGAKARKAVVEIASYNSDLIQIYKKQNLDLAPITEKIKGTLYKPEGDGPFPGVVIFHGCGGPLENTYMWARWYQERGFVSLAVDGFGPRGVKSICKSLGSIKRSTRINDAYGGAAYLASLPFVDKSKIGITGFSNGAGRALNVVEERYQEKVADAIPKFAFSIPLYPECRTDFGYNSSGFAMGPYGSPVLILIGESDDWTLAKSCQTVAELTKDHQHPVRVLSYPNAHHGFDHNRDDYYLRDADNMNSPTGRGATVQSNPTAAKAAKKDVESFLRELGIL